MSRVRLRQTLVFVSNGLPSSLRRLYLVLLDCLLYNLFSILYSSVFFFVSSGRSPLEWRSDFFTIARKNKAVNADPSDYTALQKEAVPFFPKELRLRLEAFPR